MMKIIKHRNKWNWGSSVVCVTNDGYGIATVSFVNEYEFDEDTQKFMPTKEAVISGISVYNKVRKQGYGNMLLAECEKEAAKKGFDKVYLYSDPGSFAFDWYERHGYETTSECCMTLSNTNSGDEELEPLIKLVKKLT